MNATDAWIVLFAAGQVVLAMTLVIALAGAASCFLRRHPAARERLWRAALFGVLLSPLVPWLGHALTSEVITLHLPGEASAVVSDEPASTTTLTERIEPPMVSPEPPPRGLPAPTEPIIAPPPVMEPAAEVPVEMAPAVSSLDNADQGASSGWGMEHLTMLLAVAWMAGCLWHAGRLAVGWLRCRAVLGSSVPLDADRFAAELRTARDLIGTTPSVLVSPDARGPGVIGVLRPRIVLPTSLLDWAGSEELVQVLIHEAAHVTRRDPITNFLQMVARCLYWPHPLVHWLNHRLREAREEVCDNVVLAHARASSYAETLLNVTQRCQPAAYSFAGLAMVPRRGSLEQRVGDLLDPQRNRATDWPLPRRLAAQAALLCVLVCVGMVKVETDSTRADEPEQLSSTDESGDNEDQPADVHESTPDDTAKKTTVPFTGRVLRPDGSPAQGADVVLLGPPNNGNGYKWPLPVEQTTTDKEGRYQFQVKTHGKHTLWANLNEFTSRKGRIDGTDIQIPKSGEPPEPVALKLRRGVSVRVLVKDAKTGQPIPGATVDFIGNSLPRAFTANESGVAVVQPLTALPWQFQAFADGHAQQTRLLNLQNGKDVETEFSLDLGTAITGTVRNQAGEPIEGGGVSVRAEGTGPMEWVPTDQDGRYRISNVPLKKVRITASAEGYEDHVMTLQPSEKDGDINFTLVPRNHGGSIQGIVVDTNGKPIAGATLLNYGWSSADERKTKTDDDGRFVMKNLYEGSNGPAVIVRAKGFAPKWVGVKPGSAAEPAEVKITLEDGRHIRGQVVDEQGKPIEGVRVYEIPTYGTMAPGQETTTDARGRFRFDSLPPKSPFTFVKRGYSKIEHRKLPLDGEEVATVVMKPEGVIHGRVVDAKSGKPIPTFNVRITFSPQRKPDEPSPSLRTALVDPGQTFQSEEGTFKIDELTAGMPLQVMVSAEGYEQGVKERVVAETASEVESVEFSLTPVDPSTLTTYAGRLLGPDGQPIVGAAVRLIAAKNRDPDDRYGFPFNWKMIETGQLESQPNVLRFEEAATDAEGRFTFSKIPKSAEVELVWWGGSAPPGRRPLEKLDEQERTSIELHASKPARVSVTIDRDAFPDAASINFFRRRNDVYGYETKRLEKGKSTYEFTNLPEGTYAIHLEGPSEPVPGVPNGVTAETLARTEAIIKPGETAKIMIDRSHAVDEPNQ